MALMAMALPIVPGKEAKWKEMMEKINQEPLKSQFRASREKVGAHERTFLQETPNGMIVIVTLEADDPQAAFGKMMADESMKDFMEWAADVHGVDFNAGPPSPPRLVVDSKA